MADTIRLPYFVVSSAMSFQDIQYATIPPPPVLAGFVESFWMLANPSDNAHEVVILPDGRIDLFFSVSATEPYHVTLAGLDSEASQTSIFPHTRMFAVSFKLLAVEYLLDIPLSTLVNSVGLLPDDYLGMSAADLTSFDSFCAKAAQHLTALVLKEPDDRKRQLFELLYTSHGNISVKELSAAVYWSSRQINRYFNQWFGLSLKAYCNILRFRASFQHIKEGKLFPEQNFTDQAHFIHTIRRYAGVVPKELHQNKNDRFIQFSALPKK